MPCPPARTAVYAGSFDPPTNGHLWMIEQGAQLFDYLIVAIGENAAKKTDISISKRLKMLRAITAHLPNVSVTSFSGEYLVNFAKRVGANFILRGARNIHDYQYEQTLRMINGDLSPTITTVMLMPPRHLAEVSSSSVKALMGPRGWKTVVKNLVPPSVFKIITARSR